MSQHPVRRFVGAGLIGLSAFALAACGGKPSEGDIKDKLVELYTAGQGEVEIPKEQAEKLADCVAPKLHDKMSEDGLNTLMDVDAKDITTDKVPDISKADEDAFTGAITDCASAVTD